MVYYRAFKRTSVSFVTKRKVSTKINTVELSAEQISEAGLRPARSVTRTVRKRWRGWTRPVRNEDFILDPVRRLQGELKGDCVSL